MTASEGDRQTAIHDIQQIIIPLVPCIFPGPYCDPFNLVPGGIEDGVTSCDYTRDQHKLPRLASRYGSTPKFPSETLDLHPGCQECFQIFSQGMLGRRLTAIKQTLSGK